MGDHWAATGAGLCVGRIGNRRVFDDEAMRNGGAWARVTRQRRRAPNKSVAMQ